MADARTAAMRDQGVYRCPKWCSQPADEEKHEQHVGEWRVYTNQNGDVVRLRPRLSWDETTEQLVEVDIEPAPGEPRTAWLTEGDLASVRALLDAAEEDLTRFDTKESYDGAEDDE